MCAIPQSKRYQACTTFSICEQPGVKCKIMTIIAGSFGRAKRTFQGAQELNSRVLLKRHCKFQDQLPHRHWFPAPSPCGVVLSVSLPPPNLSTSCCGIADVASFAFAPTALFSAIESSLPSQPSQAQPDLLKSRSSTPDAYTTWPRS